jgi:predicted HicB family RNase H-like nuclease
MGANKTAALNIRIHPHLKEAIRIAAKREHRSVANMVETLIIQHCEEVGISIPEQQALFEEPSDE